MVEHAEYELNLILDNCKDDEEAYKMQKAVNDNILEVVKAFAEGGHSGFSANYAIPIIERLLRQSFVLPLTGEDSEWVEVADGVYQNKRESSIFKSKNMFDGKPYYLDGKAFSDDGGKTWYTNGDSFVPIEFPLAELPKTEYIILKEDDINGKESC